MKKRFVVFVLLALTFTLFAEDPTPEKLRTDNALFKAAWTPFQLSLFPEKYCQFFPASTKVYGIGIGATLLEQEAGTLSVGLTCCLNKNYGLQCAGATVTTENYGLDVGALAAFTGRNYGLQISLANVEGDGEPKKKEDGPRGFQIGFLNIGAGYQIGFLNYNPQGYWFPLTLIFNFPR